MHTEQLSIKILGVVELSAVGLWAIAALLLVAGVLAFGKVRQWW